MLRQRLIQVMFRLNQLKLAAGQQQPPQEQELERLTTKTWSELYNGQTEDADGWYDQLKVRLPFCQTEYPEPTRQQPPNTLRLVCISDTHERLMDPEAIPAGDVLIHAGDFTLTGSPDKVAEFNTFLEALPHEHKLVIAGNHELTFDQPQYAKLSSRFRLDPDINPSDVKAMLTACTYLEEEGVSIQGVKFFGSPYQPEFGGWAFNSQRGDESRARVRGCWSVTSWSCRDGISSDCHLLYLKAHSLNFTKGLDLVLSSAVVGVHTR
eukprot:m.206455 g.206455  ORF g.206455 m.206455 type:complete len:266 (+) comp17105_c0_seq2:43-840(+)